MGCGSKSRWEGSGVYETVGECLWITWEKNDCGLRGVMGINDEFISGVLEEDML